VFTPSVCCTGSTANQFNYTTANHPTPSLIENIIQLAGPDRGSEGIAAVTNWIRHDALTPFVRFFGTMHYVTTGAPTMHFGSIAYDGNPEACTGYIITDSVVHANGSASRPIQVGQGATPAQGCDGSNPGAPQQLTRVNSVRGSTASTYGHATLTNVNESTTIGGTGFDYVGTGNTAKLCFRYVDGVYTATPLWPWPMDGRIKAAIEMNAGRGSVALTGGAGTGYQAGTVTSEIASIFGPIPAACNSSGGPFVPNFPTASDFPSTPIIDDFNRANGSIGPNYTWAVGSGYTISGNLALAPVGATRGWWNADTFTASHEVYATWPTVPSGDSVLLTFAGPDLADNGYHLILTRSGGNAFLRVARITGGYTEILGPINLGTDVANGQSFGIRVSPTQTISMYWKYSDGLWYRIGSVIDTNLPATARIGVGGILSNTINDLGGGTCCGGAVSPANIGRFGTRFPTQ
jgi:hypothetical protein